MKPRSAAAPPIGDLESLLGHWRAGARPRFVFFWGHRPRPDGTLGASCFSQWWPRPFTVDRIRYLTAEHFMMAEKARLFGDSEAEANILGPSTPAEAKKLGRRVRDFDDEIWSRERFDLVVRGNLAKFSQSPELMGYLLGTHDAVLVEASPSDRIWGIGLERDDPRASDPERWNGLNLLGFALMEVRFRLAAPEGSRRTSPPP